MKKFEWHIDYDSKQHSVHAVKKVRSRYNVSNAIAKILLNRFSSMEEMDSFLDVSYENLQCPFLFKEMESAVKRILQAKERSEKVLIHGDYDADGITSTAMLKLYFRKLNIKHFAFLPSRSLGYGLCTRAVVHAIRRKYSLIITCDCGSNEHNQIAMAKSSGIDVIVLDHHCFSKRPDVYAFINPENNDYPFKHLCAGGVTFKFLQALNKYAPVDFDIRSFLDFVALATIADVVPMIGENRIMTKIGLKTLYNSENLGIRKLIDVCSLKNRNITADVIGYIVAPKINAAGRIASPLTALKLFTTTNETNAENISRKLANLNRKRMQIEQSIKDEAIKQAEEYAGDNFLVLSSNDWHKGIIGIVASTIVELYHKPVVIISNGYGSARTIKEVNLMDCLSKCTELFEKFGGHEMAAGLQIRAEKIEPFRLKINTIVNRRYEPYLKYDLKLHVSDISTTLLNDLNLFEPFGHSNNSLNFVLEDIRIASAKVTKNGQHLQLILAKDNKIFPAIGFWMADYKSKLTDPAQKIDLLFSLERGQLDNAQLVIKDLKVVNLDW